MLREVSQLDKERSAYCGVLGNVGLQIASEDSCSNFQRHMSTATGVQPLCITAAQEKLTVLTMVVLQHLLS